MSGFSYDAFHSFRESIFPDLYISEYTILKKKKIKQLSCVRLSEIREGSY